MNLIDSWENVNFHWKTTRVPDDETYIYIEFICIHINYKFIDSIEKFD